MTFGSLFSGIGGIDLGLQRSGMDCLWQVEINDFCRKVLTKHWPNIPKFKDVREFPGQAKSVSGFSVDVLAGGFPCQDISVAGKRTGIDGEMSGLWREYARIVGVLRPKYVVVENTSGFFSSGIGRVLGDLAEIGYDAEWESLSAHEFGADHIRERAFIVAIRRPVLHSNCQRCKKLNHSQEPRIERILDRSTMPNGARWESTKSIVVRGIHGIPGRVDRIRGLGNCVVPQIAEWIGKRIILHSRLTKDFPP